MDQVFKKLTELIKNNDHIFIMTHRNPDFDGMGSAIALQQIINKFNKSSYIVRNYKDDDHSLAKAYQYMEDRNIKHSFISKTDALNVIEEDSLLIILDTQKEQLVEQPQLLKYTKNIVVLDHHIKGRNSIVGSFSYINSNLSSTVELIVNYIKYLNFEINPLIATYLLIGLEIDTNSFTVKTTDKTYEAAAILARQGADNVIKQEILQEEKDNYMRKQALIAKSYMLNDNIAICEADDNIYDNQDLAIVALKLLQFENVEASFVIGKIKNNVIGISARSIDRIDVEKIMSRLGGGGHLNEAAAQIEGSSIENVKKQLIETIGGYNESNIH